MHTIASVLMEIFLDVGFPKILQSDNGKEFVNRLMTLICKSANIDSRLISAYHARANGVAERFVQTISQSVLKILDGRLDNWELHVRPVQYYTNGKVSALHSSTPFSLLFARPMNSFKDYRDSRSELLQPDQLLQRVKYLNELVYPAVTDKIKRKQSEDMEMFNKRFKNKLYDESYFIPGSWVMAKDELRADKVSPRYEGPFEIIRRNRGGSYVLRGSDDTIYQRPASTLKLVTRNPVMTLPTDHCEVDYIIDHRPKNSNPTVDTEYLTKWKGSDVTMSSWVKSKDFNGPALILKYHKSLRKIRFIEPASSKTVRTLRPRQLSSVSSR
jgi:hypothetical protein